ncbi:MAG: hypothetical protein JNM10_08315 [Planctomycetia bacterium]|nr:hypothetical protein [Planctomycetia bacterium]
MYDPYDPLGGLRRVLAYSWRLGHLFGIEIRVYWTAVLVLLVSVYQTTRWPGVGLLEGFALGLGFQAGLYLIVLVHELCHAWAGRRYRIQTPTITLSALGGLAHMAAPPPHPRAEIVVAIAGPLSHVPWILLGLLLDGRVAPLRVGSYGFPLDLGWYLWFTNVWLLGFNLLPLFPMDGGRVLRGTLALRRHPNWATLWTARIGIFGAIALMAWGMSDRGFGGTLLFLIGLSNLQVCLQELAAARHTDGPYAAVDAWGQDPDAWKRGAGPDDADERPSRRGRWSILRRGGDPRRAADRRPPAPLAPPPASPSADDAELDRLLAKVGEVGLPGLSDAERATLQRISESRRRRR